MGHNKCPLHRGCWISKSDKAEIEHSVSVSPQERLALTTVNRKRNDGLPKLVRESFQKKMIFFLPTSYKMNRNSRWKRGGKKFS